jgi:hypothetical protein
VLLQRRKSERVWRIKKLKNTIDQSEYFGGSAKNIK